MKLKIQLFASVREKLGKNEILVPTKDNLTVGELKKQLMDLYPEVADTIRSGRISVNLQFLEDHQVISPTEDREIAFIPPVSGG